MLMQVGFLLLEAGMVRSKNSINVAQKNLLDFVFGVIAFAAVGFMFAFGRSGGLPFGYDGDLYFLHGLTADQAAFFVFQVMFCGTAATVVSGAVAERMKLSAYVFGSLVLSGFIYPVFVHWAWGSALFHNSSAYLAEMGFVDFAGSTVVHSTGGWMALAACLVIGPRLGRFNANGTPVRIAGHSPVLSTTGALLLFIGWIGFNGGSTLAASEAVPAILLNTILAGGMGTCVGYVVGYYQDGVILPEKSNCGMLGGLVAVTAGCHLFDRGAHCLSERSVVRWRSTAIRCWRTGSGSTTRWVRSASMRSPEWPEPFSSRFSRHSANCRPGDGWRSFMSNWSGSASISIGRSVWATPSSGSWAGR
nr:diguanylate cyclase [Rhizobium sp. Q54]